ncbi:hypothetical protein Sked_15040 [Sanguibacter keddieii DSM 10542]|uniref:DUF7832 domain-containing protein n=1 Tax=Sanguibacter keddieii (strain ATCC 51767 / DSM 10542 / NCFB 3025 / ST-74) TaxID=446469 RepID=D1BFS9_SANKS|nr:hypothetical protein [Sanguibacter keddieii]ACZ21440.1 hypothetical protein Sked_15040 [Sanguibacter keddieii DSM 10542]
MKFDDATWHSEGTFPADLPPEAGATHIGIFLTWLIRSQHLTDQLFATAEDDIFAVQAGTMSGAEFLLTWFDGQLTDTPLSRTGADFTMAYYEGAGGDVTFIADYADAFSDDPDIDTLYRVPDTQESYEKVAAVISYRFEQWQHAGRPPFLS